MSKRNIFLIIGAALVVAGILLGAFGFLIGGATKGVYIDENGLHVREEGKSEIMSTQLSEFKNIDIKTGSMRIELVESDKNMVEYVCAGGENLLTCEVVDGTFTFKTKWSINLMMFSFADSYVKIYYKSGSAFDNVSVVSGSGSIYVEDINAKSLYTDSSSGSRKLFNVNADSIKAAGSSGSLEISSATCKTADINNTSGRIKISGLDCSSADIKNVSGSINLTGFKGDSATVKASSGSITLDEFICDTADVKNTSGKIYIINAKSNGLNLNAVSGSVNVQGELKGKTTVHCVSGSIKVYTSLDKDTYGIKLSSISGSTKIDDETFKGTMNAGKENFIDASTASGSIKVYFNS